ncbi:hypothetical protein QE152_g36748 [Popillia japonica]|uniref:DUF8207 domain-containing protein n=1 Tax=Popillia japonica TaxID=7064 RepID=A0AAW1ICL8_POPJA
MTDEKEEFDEKYGNRETEGKLKLGNADVRRIREKLPMPMPENYKYILKNTHSYKIDYNPNKKTAASRGTKYMKFMKPILEGHPPNVWWTRNWKTGLGLGNIPL